jgi:hypothetical protein
MDRIKIFVNEKSVLVVPGTTVGAAVRHLEGTTGAGTDEGSGYLTDGVGRRLEPETIVAPGMIIRSIAGRPLTE